MLIFPGFVALIGFLTSREAGALLTGTYVFPWTLTGLTFPWTGVKY